MTDYSELAAFVALAETKSFSGAARKLKCQKSTISRKILNLEERLGTSLVLRTTRKVKLNRAGEQLFNEIQPSFAHIDRATQEVFGASHEIQGSIRLTAPSILGLVLLPEALATFSQKFPRVTVDILLDDRVLDFVSDRIDIAIRTGPLENSNLKSRKLGDTEFSLFVSPNFSNFSNFQNLKEDLHSSSHSVRLQDLNQLPGIVYTPDGEAMPWTLVNHKGNKLKLNPVQCLRASTLQMAKELAKAGAGVALLPEFICQDELIAGELVQIFSEWKAEKSVYSIVYPDKKKTSLAVTELVKHLIPYVENSVQTKVRPQR